MVNNCYSDAFIQTSNIGQIGLEVELDLDNGLSRNFFIFSKEYGKQYTHYIMQGEQEKIEINFEGEFEFSQLVKINALINFFKNQLEN